MKGNSVLNGFDSTSDIAPDFIIAGAMKSGTTTLHSMLAEHPSVFMANNELFFYDMDDLAQHPDFFQYRDNKWQYADIAHQQQHYFTWYQEQFSAAKPEQIKGEDSTTYMVSELAIKRLAALASKPKLILVLRHPTERIYSHYWHMVRAGRAIYSFEDTLRFQPSLLIQRSDYTSQLRCIYRYFNQDDVHVVLFDDLVKSPQETLKGVAKFLSIDANKFPADSFAKHSNKGQVPMFLRLHLLKCRLFREMSARSYNHHFNLEKKQTKPLLERIYGKLNPMLDKKPPKIRVETQVMLDNYFLKTQADLDELVGSPVLSRWFGI